MKRALTFSVYKDNRHRWVFDDAEHHLCQEPFVAGMDQVIDHLVRDHPDAIFAEMNLVLDETPPPQGFEFLTLLHDEALHHPLLGQSNYYHCTELGIRAWLCNNLYRYVDHTPKILYCWAHFSLDSVILGYYGSQP